MIIRMYFVIFDFFSILLKRILENLEYPSRIGVFWLATLDILQILPLGYLSEFKRASRRITLRGIFQYRLTDFGSHHCGWLISTLILHVTRQTSQTVLKAFQQFLETPHDPSHRLARSHKTGSQAALLTFPSPRGALQRERIGYSHSYCSKNPIAQQITPPRCPTIPRISRKSGNPVVSNSGRPHSSECRVTLADFQAKAQSSAEVPSLLAPIPTRSVIASLTLRPS